MLTEQQQAQLDWEKTDGLLPVVVQHAVSGEVLMLGYMNQDALAKTIDSGKVTFYSRTKQRLWTKGETSGHFLNVVSITPDCDNDTLLVLANPSAQPAIRAPAAASARRATSGCSCINWNSCWQSVKRRIRKFLYREAVRQRNQAYCAEGG
jgi:phosphoribosyl-AMP cyclohydrolase